MSDFNSWCVAFSSHVGDTGMRLPGLSVGPPRSMSSEQSLIHDFPGDCSACQSLYVPNSGCWRNAPLLLQTQLERIARPRSRRDHQRNVSALTTHSRTKKTIIEKKIEFLVPRIEYQKKTILTSLVSVGLD